MLSALRSARPLRGDDHTYSAASDELSFGSERFSAGESNQHLRQANRRSDPVQPTGSARTMRRVAVLGKSYPTLRQARPRGVPEAAMRVRKISAQCVLQFTPSLAAGCVLHRPVSRVIHCSELSFLVGNLTEALFAFEFAFWTLPLREVPGMSLFAARRSGAGPTTERRSESPRDS